jgi:glutamate formiminotransferase/formiminotetrahydrofolate cyclodeaminase
VPVAGVTMQETVEYARELAGRLGDEAGLTVYCYEKAASQSDRSNLATVRAGEYEGLADKLADPDWQPDFGPATFNERSGATAVGARDFLVAYNINLNSTSTRRANAIAFDVREKGRIKREPELTGDIVRDESGDPVWVPGSLKSTKAIGWFIEEYGIAQISMNLTDISVTSVHAAFDECRERARAHGVRVTGSELVGLIPLGAMLDAGRHYLRKQHRSTGVSDAELLKIAVRSLGLDDLAPFDPSEKIIEYAIRDRSEHRLVDRTVQGFVEETASDSPAPGGGSVSAAVGALGAALGTMVANLSSHKRGWDDRWEEFSDQAERGKAAHTELLELVDRDTAAFNELVAAWKADPVVRDEAIQSATQQAIEVPLRVMEVALESMEVLRAMALGGVAASVSDAGVGAICARAAVAGAGLNVQINAGDLTDEEAQSAYLQRAEELTESATRTESEILAIVDRKLNS